jgi:FixJ family two-component response regulator
MSGATPSRAVVHVVDDDQSVRTALSRLLRTAQLDVRTYASAREFLERPAEAHDAAGCVVLDLNMPGISGLELQDALALDPAALPVVFLTGYGDIPASVRAMKAGAVDFLTKPVDRERLLTVIGIALERDVERRRQRHQAASLEARFAALTPREQEVFDLLVTGMLNKQVGVALGTTERTVKAHRAHIMRKLEVDSVAELVRLAVALGRVPPGPAA